MRCTITIFFLAISFSTLADDLTIPNTFQSGTPARAAEVNDNFTAVESSVDDNAADIVANTMQINANAASITAVVNASGVPVYAQGIQIGRFLSGFGDHIYLTNDQGFIIPLTNVSTPSPYVRVLNLFYTEQDCGGAVYTSIGTFDPWVLTLGVIFAPPGSIPATELYYSARGSVREQNVVYQSENTGGNCSNLSVAATASLFRVFPNDVGVTGVSNSSVAGPLKIGTP